MIRVNPVFLSWIPAFPGMTVEEVRSEAYPLGRRFVFVAGFYESSS